MFMNVILHIVVFPLPSMILKGRNGENREDLAQTKMPLSLLSSVD